MDMEIKKNKIYQEVNWWRNIIKLLINMLKNDHIFLSYLFEFGVRSFISSFFKNYGYL